MARGLRRTPIEEITRDVILVPQSVIDAFVDDRSVWEQLYAWLCVERGLTDDHDMHARVYAGHRLMRSLIRRERARLARIHHIGGVKLARTLAWSNMGSGPMEEWDGHRIKGDGCFVLPPEETN